VDLCKVPHHGSAHNVSPALIQALDCRHWLISTNGERFRHPSRRAIARIVAARRGATLWFNYHCDTTQEFAKRSLAGTFGCRAVHPPPTRPGLALTISNQRVEEAAG
jgi:hypothetical protein